MERPLPLLIGRYHGDDGHLGAHPGLRHCVPPALTRPHCAHEVSDIGPWVGWAASLGP